MFDGKRISILEALPGTLNIKRHSPNILDLFATLQATFEDKEKSLKRPLKNRQTKILKTNSCLMKVESIPECNNRSLKPNFGLLFKWLLKTGFTVQLL